MRLLAPRLGLFLALLAFACILPSTSNRLFASPDETAVAVSIQELRTTGSAAVNEELARSFPWLHPRSYTASGEALVPVGFLGWPWLLAQFNRFLPFVVLPWFASILAISGALPWYGLLRRKFGDWAAWWGTALAWFFPPVLLYSNRALFSHIPQISGALWTVWLLVKIEELEWSRWSKRVVQLLAGVVFGLALSFRPIEAVWLVPMAGLLVSRFRRLPRVDWLCVGVGAVIGLVPLLIAQAATYGQWFQIGYWIQANTDPSAIYQPSSAAVAVRPWYLAFAPYGLHPKNVWWNIRSFFLTLLWPWLVASLFSMIYLIWRVRTTSQAKLVKWRQIIIHERRFWVSVVVLCVAAGWLLAIYGSGLYFDHIQAGAVTLGNSFLRYTLPIGFAAAWLFASVASTLKSGQLPRQIFVLAASGLLLASGYLAFFHDNENLFMTRNELVRYATIREAANQAFRPGDVILSDRSDKIFFPQLRGVSPMPSPDQLSAFTERTQATSTSLGLFSRPLSLSDRDAWRRMGYDVHELQVFGRERLYRLTPFLR